MEDTNLSLKNFHIIFIIISSIFMLYFAYWSYNHWQLYKDTSYIGYFILSVISFFILLFYSKKFVKKFKGITS